MMRVKRRWADRARACAPTALLLIGGPFAARAAASAQAPVAGNLTATASPTATPNPTATANPTANPTATANPTTSPPARSADGEGALPEERILDEAFPEDPQAAARGEERAAGDVEATALGGEALESISDEGGAEVDRVPAAAANAAAQHTRHPQGLQLFRKAALAGEGDRRRYVAALQGGKIASLTVEPALQQEMQKLLRLYRPPAGAIVALEPKTGRVLALAEFAQDGSAEGLATRPLYPAASVFKIITGAALLEKGISPDAETCYHGGVRRIVDKLLEDKPRADRRCLSLSMALAKSANLVFAKMAVKHLDGRELREAAERFLFNRPIWDQPIEQSSAAIPDGKLELAKSAAGFGQVKLSPLHAALIAAAVGNGGVAYEPTFIDQIDGEPAAPTGALRLLQPETAATLRDMMKYTVLSGTATSSFRERGRSVLGDIAVAGKTGSLSSHGQRPFKDYSWFVGFAPADDPKIAVAAVVVNGLKWRIHAPYVAREAFRAYLVGGSMGQPPAARVRRHRRYRHHR